MKYLKKYENVNEKFDLDFVLTKIKEEFSEDKVSKMLDEEILEWVDSDWQDDFDSEYEWYVEYNNKEAEDVIIDQIISWYEKNYEKLNTENRITIEEEMSKIYSL